jgi:hypothetical protein
MARTKQITADEARELVEAYEKREPSINCLIVKIDAEIRRVASHGIRELDPFAKLDARTFVNRKEEEAIRKHYLEKGFRWPTQDRMEW